MLLHKLDRFRDVGLLLLRLGIGGTYIFVHGMGKLFGGPDRWERLGDAMSQFGIDFLPTFWGFMAAFAEFGGGILLVLGLFFRPALLVLLLPTMIVAAVGHFTGDIPGAPWHAAKMAILFFSLIFIGPGDYSLDAVLYRRRRIGY